MSPEFWKSPSVEVLVELRPFDKRAVRFDYSANVAGLAEKLACYPNS